MADTGLLDLGALMQQLGPSEDEKRMARAQAAIMAGLGMIGARKGYEAQDISRAALGGMLDYNQQMRDSGDDKLKRLSLAQHLAQMQQQQQTVADQNALRQAYQQMPSAPSPSAGMPSLAPTLANAAELTQRQQAQPANDPYSQYIAKADYLDAFAQKTGNMAAKAEADKYREHALKFRDENQGFETVIGPDGKPALVQRRKYGAPQQMPYQPKPEIATVHAGDRTEFYNKLQPPTSPIMHGTSPDTIYSGNVTMRGQNMTDARARELNAINAGAGQILETPNGYVRVGKDNTATPILAGGAQLQPKPTGAIVQQVAQNNVTLNKIDRALEWVDKTPNAFGLKNVMGDQAMQRFDPSGVAARAMVADIAGQKIHDRSGAAVTVGEAERLRPYVPNVTDHPDVVKKKLGMFKREYQQMQSELAGGRSIASVAYSGNSGASGGWSIQEVK